MPAIPPPGPPPTLHKDWTVGDVRLVSSDNIAFQINKYILFGASSVLRDMSVFDEGNRDICFDDPIIERADIICLLLQVITTGNCVFTTSLNDTFDVLKLCDKYECTVASQVIIALLHNVIGTDHPVSLTAAFIIGAIRDNLELCTAALKRSCELVAAGAKGRESTIHTKRPRYVAKWGSTTQQPGSGAKLPRIIPCVTNFPYSAWVDSRQEYIWALLRAKELGRTDSRQEDPDTISTGDDEEDEDE